MARPAAIPARIGLYAAALLIAGYAGFPIYWMIVSSLREPAALLNQIELLPSPLSLQSYRNLLELTDYPAHFANSAIVALVTVAVTMVFSVMIAYAVTRQRIRGKKLIVGAMLYAYMFPPLLIAIPMYTIFAQWGLGDTLAGLIAAHLTLTLPLGVWFLWGFFKNMPFELEEAAMVDGCTRLGAFVRVVLPLALPGLITVSIFSFLLSWTDYTFALIMIGSDANKTLPVGLASMLGSFDLRWGEVMAGATLIALPLFVAFAFLTKYFIQGLGAGAVKG
ncbi:carbohydrate ABC transporter permease [Verminephrobacter eiseniae]|uniref:Binding-protein-dependent transport systems inner membrane component n=1 Tax=Verminephrobacter eiseniae (strain EF01-2) TaxID=391735 RepID=A1WJ27_VEREI|nr:carbohydrate ABC transporter permease [Verminephrobacter eiseniae]ABM57634.1 binding-protein-dependent transport systems inner membrane component [Verminephrobacter eiseniae EF01-2]MCW5283254.1 carbohydrate ABC transporter permease [Verminephrobacter eiseniae]MCW5303570.1 carbohydrate ABC transporter permease [Verminephrobacter eiseniae]MCW8181922.1 carbohydrate ABC transporter permease [Verminephrobacter eiseniae]MCW8188364.1 carbohydrate ABC transporter permease [Verminephrobacter eisenia